VKIDKIRWILVLLNILEEIKGGIYERLLVMMRGNLMISRIDMKIRDYCDGK
jgi:hypothetical protein